ncbi:MAG: hypothetical protein HY402_06990 [Elusimicrobia bacterium]|nr:hypothetical protein [Elusimicrobiota bacterium]
MNFSNKGCLFGIAVLLCCALPAKTQEKCEAQQLKEAFGKFRTENRQGIATYQDFSARFYEVLGLLGIGADSAKDLYEKVNPVFRTEVTDLSCPQLKTWAEQKAKQPQSEARLVERVVSHAGDVLTGLEERRKGFQSLQQRLLMEKMTADRFWKEINALYENHPDPFGDRQITLANAVYAYLGKDEHAELLDKFKSYERVYTGNPASEEWKRAAQRLLPQEEVGKLTTILGVKDNKERIQEMFQEARVNVNIFDRRQPGAFGAGTVATPAAVQGVPIFGKTVNFLALASPVGDEARTRIASGFAKLREDLGPVRESQPRSGAKPWYKNLSAWGFILAGILAALWGLGMLDPKMALILGGLGIGGLLIASKFGLFKGNPSAEPSAVKSPGAQPPSPPGVPTEQNLIGKRVDDLVRRMELLGGLSEGKIDLAFTRPALKPDDQRGSWKDLQAEAEQLRGEVEDSSMNSEDRNLNTTRIEGALRVAAAGHTNNNLNDILTRVLGSTTTVAQLEKFLQTGESATLTVADGAQRGQVKGALASLQLIVNDIPGEGKYAALKEAYNKRITGMRDILLGTATPQTTPTAPPSQSKKTVPKTKRPPHVPQKPDKTPSAKLQERSVKGGGILGFPVSEVKEFFPEGDPNNVQRAEWFGGRGDPDYIEVLRGKGLQPSGAYYLLCRGTAIQVVNTHEKNLKLPTCYEVNPRPSEECFSLNRWTSEYQYVSGIVQNGLLRKIDCP